MADLFTNGLNVWFLVKALALVLTGMYLVFAFVVIRQVKLMTETLRVGFEREVRSLSYLHLAFAVLVFLAALVVL
ncbi:MAG: DUF5657 family protein [Candidatus Microgenomates bacterium]|jgi:hypothetical protein